MIERGDDPKCKGYKKQFVDRGYGYPVCPSNNEPLYPLKTDSKYIGQFSGDTVVGIKQNTDDIRL